MCRRDSGSVPLRSKTPLAHRQITIRLLPRASKDWDRPQCSLSLRSPDHASDLVIAVERMPIPPPILLHVHYVRPNRCASATVVNLPPRDTWNPQGSVPARTTRSSQAFAREDVLSAVALAAWLLRCTPDNQRAHESYRDSYRYTHTACHTTGGTIGLPPCLRCFQKHVGCVLPSLQLTWGGLACQPSEVIIRRTQ